MQTKSIPELLFRDGAGCINLVAEHEEGNLGQFFDRQERVELGFGFVEAFDVLRINEEDDAVNFGEVVLPQAASCKEWTAKLSACKVWQLLHDCGTHLVGDLLDRKL